MRLAFDCEGLQEVWRGHYERRLATAKAEGGVMASMAGNRKFWYQITINEINNNI